MPHRDFDFPVHTDAEPGEDPITFGLAGKDPDTGEVVAKETFTVRDRLPLAAFAELGVATSGGWVASQVGVARFFDKVVRPEERARWRAFVDDDRLVVDVADCVPIIEYVVEAASNRPTGAPSGSPAGRSPSGPSSTGAALSGEATPAT